MREAVKVWRIARSFDDVLALVANEQTKTSGVPVVKNATFHSQSALTQEIGASRQRRMARGNTQTHRNALGL